MSLSGVSMGRAEYSGMSRVGGSACASTEWRSDSVVLCGVVAGVGGTRRASVSVGVQVGTATRVVSYDGAAVGGGGSVSASNAASRRKRSGGTKANATMRKSVGGRRKRRAAMGWSSMIAVPARRE